ncbi:unnamed protein product [Phytophthora fragariaefolia]|uniref:Unnamed protein product n=1 Tax=Phytophthora fragariaefolia TaxID=1490495 RepID=A0A9W7CUI3_9STRA|nr:unnamed protein product [Phytophthora fragariaefolia]
MARSKEQWKAQQRAQHTQTKTNNFFQMKRPSSAAPSATSALFQLGRPTSAAAAAAVRPAVLKSDPVTTPSHGAGSLAEATCIDLTLDEDDDEEDEPMGGREPAVRAATAAPAVAMSAAELTSSADSGAVQSGVLGETGIEPAAAKLPSQGPEPAPEMMTPLVEDVESDVDEEWPSVPPSVSEQSSAGQTEEDVRVALEAIQKTILLSQDKQEPDEAESNTQAKTAGQTIPPPIPTECDDAMEADEDEELPSIAPKGSDASPDSLLTLDRIVRVQNLEDGEIFEEGAVPQPGIQIQRAIALEQQRDAHPVDAMEVRPHLRNKKQKKRGKKKAKRKLETMLMLDSPPGEMPPNFERMTHQRPFGDALPPGPFTYAMMRNDPRSEPVNVRPVFQDPPPASFRPGRMFVSAPRPPMRPPLPQLSAPPMPPLPYGDSQILRVNRQGSMEMIDSEANMPMFSEPPRYAGFKYRSVSMSPPRPVPGASNHALQRSASDASYLPPLPTPGHGGPSNPITKNDCAGPDQVDLDSLRAAALRSKTKRSSKNTTLTIQKSAEAQPSTSSSPPSPLPEHKQSEPGSPEIDELRLEILRSMQRKRKQSTSKVSNKASCSTQPVSEAAESAETEQSTCEKAIRASKAGNAGANILHAADVDASKTKKTPGDISLESAINDGLSCETDKFATMSELNESSDKGESPLTECAKAPKEEFEKTPEFRPLTACSQSLVIRLNPEDFSPRKCASGSHEKPSAPTSLHDAIKEMRRKIAEREKAQTSRLLESAAAKLPKSSTGQRPSSSPVAPSHSPLDLQSSTNKASMKITQQSEIAAPPPEVAASASKVLKESRTAITASQEIKTKSPANCDAQQAKVSDTLEKMASTALLSEAQSPVATAAEQNLTSAAEEIRGKALEPQSSNKTGVSKFVNAHVLPPVMQHQVLTSSDGQNGDPASEPCVKKSIQPVAPA